MAEIKTNTLDRYLIVTALVVFPVQQFWIRFQFPQIATFWGHAPLIMQSQDTSHPLPPWKILDPPLFSLVLIPIFCSLKRLPTVKVVMVLPYHANNVRTFNVIFSESLTTFALATIFKEMREFNFQFLSLSDFVRKKMMFLKAILRKAFSGGKIVKIWIINKWSALVIIFSDRWKRKIKHTKDFKQT